MNDDTIKRTLLKSAAVKAYEHTSPPEVKQAVTEIISAVRERGDAAVREYSDRFDRWSPESFRLSEEKIDEIVSQVPDQVLTDIKFAQKQVRQMAERQRASLMDFEIETLPGVHLGQKNIPVSSTASYVPGGKYPMVASSHMTIVTPKVAGVPRVIAATPPIRGEIPAATIAAMHLGGADEIYVLGGVQAIAAMALGTETIKPVAMLSGPGNAFVAEAKTQLFGEVGIDLFAGPTEILVVADGTADPYVVAVDLLSQAEHGPESPAVLITDSERVGRQVLREIGRLLPSMPTKDYASVSWQNFGQVILVESVDDAFSLADDFAFEHVEILTANPRDALEKMHHYGALFLGEGTCVPFGDKVIGTNHVLPTRGAARYTGGLWVGKYLRTVTYQEVTDPESVAYLGEVCGRAARVEHFEGHARAADVRARKYGHKVNEWEAALS